MSVAWWGGKLEYAQLRIAGCRLQSGQEGGAGRRRTWGSFPRRAARSGLRPDPACGRRPQPPPRRTPRIGWSSQSAAHAGGSPPPRNPQSQSTLSLSRSVAKAIDLCQRRCGSLLDPHFGDAVVEDTGVICRRRARLWLLWFLIFVAFSLRGDRGTVFILIEHLQSCPLNTPPNVWDVFYSCYVWGRRSHASPNVSPNVVSKY
jgi:hypothetical protein